MNQYSITVPAMFTTTYVDRAIDYYKHLINELLGYASDEDVVRHLTLDQDQVRMSFHRAYTNIINIKMPITMFEKRKVLQKWKTLLDQLITFYENTTLNGPDVPESVQRRWSHMAPRAKEWQRKGNGCDWAYCRAIYPALTDEPWWHGA
jgi:hypothetical protein